MCVLFCLLFSIYIGRNYYEKCIITCEKHVCSGRKKPVGFEGIFGPDFSWLPLGSFCVQFFKHVIENGRPFALEELKINKLTINN